MRHVRQPKGSRLCGQACVAMLLELTLDEAIALVGHRHGTKTAALVKALRAGGAEVEAGRLRPFRSRPIGPDYVGIVKLRTEGRGGWHWVVVAGGAVFDPEEAEPLELAAYLERTARDRARKRTLSSGLAVRRG